MSNEGDEHIRVEMDQEFPRFIREGINMTFVKIQGKVVVDQMTDVNWTHMADVGTTREQCLLWGNPPSGNERVS